MARKKARSRWLGMEAQMTLSHLHGAWAVMGPVGSVKPYASSGLRRMHTDQYNTTSRTPLPLA